MNPRQIHTFFRVLARELNQPARVILTGAAAGSIWGSARPSLDIDFAITLRRNSAEQWEAVERAVARTIRLTGIPANYAEDIDRWGPISLLDYRRHTRLYRRIGTLEVRLLDPAYWSIGKISRYLDPDVQDVLGALRRQRVPASRVIRVWARALRASPRSAALTQFRWQAEHFLRSHGRTIWGRRFDAEVAIRQFHRHAGIRAPHRNP
ncbi:MAG: hypothetical protein Q8R91_04550 [Candidatus Omnitrophota bacterium]|nr:hypothetical protein [Candidatus Omnitrophota bacterium]